MTIKKFSLGQLQANCYFLIKKDKCLIIDPADEANFILEKISQLKLKPVGLIATHGHFDHIMAAGEIQLSINIPFLIDLNDLFLVDRLAETAIHFLGYNPHIIKPKKVKNLPEGEFKIDIFKFKIIKTPGHTPGSSCLYFKDQEIIFTGDTLFRDGIGRYDFSYSSLANLKKSLLTLTKLYPQAIVYPGHGPDTTIKSASHFLNSSPILH